MDIKSVDFATYEKLVKSVGSLSNLFTDNSVPYLSPKFVEKLYVYTSASADFARKDMSFDAITANGAGVGVKTFGATKLSSSKTEKVAEFTADATKGAFSGLSVDELVMTVASYRNARVQSDARVFDVDLESSFYHCLVRSKNGCMIHEEPYQLIQMDKIRIQKQTENSKNPKFSDGLHTYTFSTAKNTLFKTFDLSGHTNSPLIHVEPITDVFELLLSGRLDAPSLGLADSALAPEHPYVVLPLYSTQSGTVKPSSGINQWNAGGRVRQFGEAYIPRPSEVRKAYPDFFPPQDVTFQLRVPSGKIMSAKVCQQNGKAIMSNPNSELCDWLFNLIDDDESISRARLRDARPYTTADLARIGRDSVKISLVDRAERLYELEPMSLGSYERFIEGEELETSGD